MMSDYEYDAEDFPWDEKQTVIIATKLKDMFDNIQKVVDVDLMKFTAHELEILETVYGTKLVYPIYPDIEKMLSTPESSKLLH
jgi:hypothetical protein